MACPGGDATVSLLLGWFLYDGIENITSLVERNSIFGEGGIGTFAAGGMQKLELALWVLLCTVGAGRTPFCGDLGPLAKWIAILFERGLSR